MDMTGLLCALGNLRGVLRQCAGLRSKGAACVGGGYAGRSRLSRKSAGKSSM